jgi:SAM-dependent methyltransferase
MGDKEGNADRTEIWANRVLYERYMGRWSRLIAREFLAWLAVPPEVRWLDVGCGTGVLSRMILEVASPSEVKGVNPSGAYVAFAREQICDGRASFEVGDAQTLCMEESTYDVVVAGLVLNFVPQPSHAMIEMARVVRPGGIVAAYVWDYADKMQMIRYFWDAAVTLDPRAFDLDEGQRFPICKPELLTELFRAAALRDIEVRAIDILTEFRDFNDYWSPFLGSQGPAPSYAMFLSEERRAMLRERIRASLPIALDGSISLVARAWAVRGVR